MERYIIIAADIYDHEEGVPILVKSRKGLDENLLEEDGTYASEDCDPLIFDSVEDAHYYRDEKMHEQQNAQIIRVADLTNSNNFYERDEEER